ncbi:MAG: hypothetical protein ABW321_14030, partial [Polyangiales bacterium]
ALPLLAAGSVWLALAAHVTSALAFGLWAADGRVTARPATCAVACVLVLTLPVLGAVGVWLIVVPAFRNRRAAPVDDVIEVQMPSLSHDDIEKASRPAAAPLEVTLRSGGAASRRVASVMQLRRMDAQRAVPLLRVALCDPNEDVRLLAYALLERREKDVRADIDRLLAELAQIATDETTTVKRAGVLRRLSELHWELVHGSFVSGEIEAHTLKDAVRHGHASLLLVPDGSLALLLARIRLRSAHARSAVRYLRAAEQLGVATQVLAPLYAEVAFMLRRFDVIEPLLAHAGATTARPRLDAVAQFWTGGRATV